MEVPWIRGESPVVLRMKRERSGMKISGRGAKPVETKERQESASAQKRSSHGEAEEEQVR